MKQIIVILSLIAPLLCILIAGILWGYQQSPGWYLLVYGGVVFASITAAVWAEEIAGICKRAIPAILVFCCIPSLLFAATGDIVSVAVGSDPLPYADIKIAGLATGGLYAYGLGTNGDPLTGTPKITFTVVSEGYDGTTLGTRTRTIYGTHWVRTPYGTRTIAGSYTSGTFVEGETVTQAVSGATGIVVIPASAGTKLFVRAISGTADASNIWTGVTSSATFTPTAVDVDYALAAREYNDGTSVTVRVALSEPIFQEDNTGAGNSGTAPVVNILGGFYTSGGTPNNASGASFAVTNNSTQADPTPFGQWDHIAGVATADRVSGSYTVAINARHGYGVAAVKFDALGAISGATATATTTAITQTRRSATGLYLCEHKATLSTSGFTAGETIELRARIYPKVGDTVFDTNSYTTAADELVGCNKPVIVYSSTPKYAYIDVVSGNNANTGSTNLATAVANPIQHIGKAIQNDCTVIYLKSGQTHPAVGTASSTRRTTSEWYVVQPESGHDSSDTTVQLTTTQAYKCQRLQYHNVKITLATTGSYLNGEAAGNYLRFTNCLWDSSGVAAPTFSMGYGSTATYIENCTGDMGRTGWQIDDGGGALIGFQFDGVTFDDTTTTGSVRPWYRVAACTVNGNLFFGVKSTGVGGPSQNIIFFENNRCTTQGNNAPGITVANTTKPAIGISICGNVMEKITSGGRPIWLAADSRTVDVENVIVCHNTTVGDNNNFIYNDAGTASLYARNLFVRGNIMEVMSNKQDTFGTPNGNRTGGWSWLYGCGGAGNFIPHTTGLAVAGQLEQRFAGLRCYQPTPGAGEPPSTGSTNATTYTQFVSRQAYTGSTGAGNGDYRIHTSSPAWGLMLPGEPFFPYDLTGRPRSAVNDIPGAYADGGSRRASMFFAN